MLKSNNTYYIVLILFFLLHVSCASKKNASVVSGILHDNPKLIFLNYSVEKLENDSNSKNIQFISKIVIDGKLKTKPNVNINEGLIGDLVCKQLDQSSNTLQAVLIKNPLVKLVEYADENKELKMQKIELDKAVISLRLQLYANTKYISISNFNDKKPLLTTEISQIQ